MSEAETPVESAPAAPEPAAALTPGRALAEARTRRNQTVAEIAQQLKLSATQVEALEADDYARLPGPVFVRGFIRNYARLVELDGEALVSSLAVPQDALTAGAAIPHSHNIPFPDGRGPRWPYFAAAIGVLALLVVLFEFIMAPVAVLPSPDASPATPPAAAVAPAPGQAPVPVVTPAPPVAAPEAASPAITAADASAPAAAETVAAGPEPKSAARAGEAELHFVFETQSWVEVRDRDDRILFSQLNPAGAVQHLQAKPPLNVVVGNARGVRLTYNGRPFDLAPHTRVEVARFTLE
jgi:cytoskeleton protein RodZ